MVYKISCVDDLNGEPGAEEFEFAVGNSKYEIHLVESNRKRFLEAIHEFVKQARQVNNSGVHAVKGAELPETRRKHSREELAGCKAWLDELGVAYPTGRLADDMWKAYWTNDPSKLRPGRLARLDAPPDVLKERSA